MYIDPRDIVTDRQDLILKFIAVLCQMVTYSCLHFQKSWRKERKWADGFSLSFYPHRLSLQQPVNILISINLTTQFIENEDKMPELQMFFRTYFLSVQWQHSTSQRSILANLNVVFSESKSGRGPACCYLRLEKRALLKEQTLSSFSTYISHPNILWGRGWRVREDQRNLDQKARKLELNENSYFISSLSFHSSKYIPCFSR